MFGITDKIIFIHSAIIVSYFLNAVEKSSNEEKQQYRWDNLELQFTENFSRFHSTFRKTNCDDIFKTTPLSIGRWTTFTDLPS